MADLSGERLGPFEIRSLIGTGGFATVYRAYDSRLDTEVALKILAENHALDPAIRERFLAEANALRRVDSPSVVRIYDIQETPDARPYLVLEHADRGDLVSRRRGKIANGWEPKTADVQCLVEGLAEALDAIHAEGLVHRDITPSNVLIRSGSRTTSRPGVSVIEADERLLLSDMGLVKDLAAGSALTVGGGTAGFWAPEQQQMLTSVDHRTDIYSASALLVWLLHGDTVTSSPLWDNALRADGWPPAFVDELQRSLSVEPADRHQTIREWEKSLATALAAWATQKPAGATPIHSSAPDEKRRPNRTYAALAGVIAVGVAVLAAVLLMRPAASTIETSGDTLGSAVVNEVPGDAPVTSGPPAEPTPTQRAVGGDSGTVSTWAFATHPNGSQLVVRRVTTTSDRTTLQLQAINGRDFETTFRALDRSTRLVDNTGASFALLNDLTLSLAHGDASTFQLDFEPVPLPPSATGSTLTLEFNHSGDDELSVGEGSPSFRVVIDLTQDATVPALPRDLVINDVAIHPNNSSVAVTGIGFSETNIAVSLVAANGPNRRINMSSGHHGSFLEDDLGTRYWLKFDGTNRSLPLDENSELTAMLVFAGRLHPDAATIRLVLNHEDSSDDARSSSPRFDLGPWPLDGTFQGVDSVTVTDLPESQTHANSVAFTMSALTTDGTATRAQVVISNPLGRRITLNACCHYSYVIDNLENHYLLRSPASNDSLQVDEGEQFAGTLVFPSAVDPEATTLTLIINDRGGSEATDPDTLRPEFRFGPYTLQREPTPTGDDFDLGDFGTRSTWTTALVE